MYFKRIFVCFQCFCFTFTCSPIVLLKDIGLGLYYHIYIASTLSPKYVFGHYAFERMAPTTEQFSGAWGPRVLWLQHHSMSTFFDDNSGAGPTHKIPSSCHFCSPQRLLDTVAGPGG